MAHAVKFTTLARFSPRGPASRAPLAGPRARRALSGLLPFKSGLALAAVLAIILSAPAASKAQAPALEPDPSPAASPEDEFQNIVPKEPKGLQALQIIASFPKSPCPDEAMEISIGYLAGTGNPALDAMLREDALGRVAAAQAEASWFYEGRPADQRCMALAPEAEGEAPREPSPLALEDENYTPGPPGDVALSYHKRVLTASQPSQGVLSILYTVVRDYFLVNNPTFDYWSASYLVAEARLLALHDLFPARDASLPAFWNLAARKFCEAAGPPNRSLPVFYGYKGECPEPNSDEALPLPEALASPEPGLPDLGFPLLTPEGLTLHLNPYQSWGLAMGPVSVPITLDELKAMGANMALWGL